MRKAFTLLLAAFLLSACSNEEFQDLRDFVNNASTKRASIKTCLTGTSTSAISLRTSSRLEGASFTNSMLVRKSKLALPRLDNNGCLLSEISFTMSAALA